MLLPLNELQGEIRGLTERNILRQQVQSGGIEMQSIADTLKHSGAVEDHDSESEQQETTTNQISRQGILTFAEISTHVLQRGTQDTKL